MVVEGMTVRRWRGLGGQRCEVVRYILSAKVLTLNEVMFLSGTRVKASQILIMTRAVGTSLFGGRAFSLPDSKYQIHQETPSCRGL